MVRSRAASVMAATIDDDTALCLLLLPVDGVGEGGRRDAAADAADEEEEEEEEDPVAITDEGMDVGAGTAAVSDTNACAGNFVSCAAL